MGNVCRLADVTLDSYYLVHPADAMDAEILPSLSHRQPRSRYLSAKHVYCIIELLVDNRIIWIIIHVRQHGKVIV